MATVSNIKSDITSLNEYQLRELFNYIGEITKEYCSYYNKGEKIWGLKQNKEKFYCL